MENVNVCVIEEKSKREMRLSLPYDLDCKTIVDNIVVANKLSEDKIWELKHMGKTLSNGMTLRQAGITTDNVIYLCQQSSMPSYTHIETVNQNVGNKKLGFAYFGLVTGIFAIIFAFIAVASVGSYRSYWAKNIISYTGFAFFLSTGLAAIGYFGMVIGKNKGKGKGGIITGIIAGIICIVLSIVVFPTMSEYKGYRFADAVTFLAFAMLMIVGLVYFAYFGQKCSEYKKNN